MIYTYAMIYNLFLLDSLTKEDRAGRCLKLLLLRIASKVFKTDVKVRKIILRHIQYVNIFPARKYFYVNSQWHYISN